MIVSLAGIVVFVCLPLGFGPVLGSLNSDTAAEDEKVWLLYAFCGIAAVPLLYWWLRRREQRADFV